MACPLHERKSLLKFFIAFFGYERGFVYLRGQI